MGDPAIGPARVVPGGWCMKALVTGGAGFLGGALVRALATRGDEVRSFSRGHHPEIVALGVEHFRGDLVESAALSQAVAGCDIVFHVAARVGGWGPAAAYHQTNVVGTENVIAACREQRVNRLVYTSTPSVVHTGADIEGGDESLPYATHFTASYPRTKAEAEKLVLASNAPDLATVALRPHLVWGPGDQQLLPRLLARARAGRLRLVGDGQKLVDTTYIDNAVSAHLSAGDALSPQASCAGRAYFIAQGEPMPSAELLNAFLRAADLPPETRTVSARFAWWAGAAAEACFHLLGRAEEPPLTRFAAEQLATAHWYDLGAARRDLGYEPAVSMEQGLIRLREYLLGEGRSL
jgi:nucleoside-diphosphate-sugar epimerase